MLPKKVDRWYSRFVNTPFMRMIHIAHTVWPPAVAFVLNISLLLGISLLGTSIQHVVQPPSSYDLLTNGHAWIIGLLFIGLYIGGIVDALYGSLICAILFCGVGIATNIETFNITTLIIFLGLIYACIHGSAKKRKLLTWVQHRRYIYELKKGRNETFDE